MLRITVVGAMGGIAACLISLAAAYRASQEVPEFYRQALTQEADQQQHAGEQLEQSMFELHNEVRQGGEWQATFTDAQINGWLASDLREKFPSMLPKGVQDPRVMIDSEQAHIACRYETSKISTIVSLGLEIELTEEPNVVAVRVQKANAGLLPLPLKKFLDRITATARKADVPVRWEQTEGEPVALVTIPSEHEDYKYRCVFVDRIELRDGEIFLSGRTEQAPPVGSTAQADRREQPGRGAEQVAAERVARAAVLSLVHLSGSGAASVHQR